MDLKLVQLDIKVLGTGCAKCKSLEKLTNQAVDELQIKANIEKIEDIQKIMEYNVMSTPGLVVNGEVAVAGKLPKIEEIKEILNKYL